MEHAPWPATGRWLPPVPQSAACAHMRCDDGQGSTPSISVNAPCYTSFVLFPGSGVFLQIFLLSCHNSGANCCWVVSLRRQKALCQMRKSIKEFEEDEHHRNFEVLLVALSTKVKRELAWLARMPCNSLLITSLLGNGMYGAVLFFYLANLTPTGDGRS